MSFSAEFDSVLAIPVTAMEYRDIGGDPLSDNATNAGERGISEEELAERIRRERAEATQLAEQRLRQDYEAKLQATRAPIAATLKAFETERGDYFAHVEAEIVQLALAIAAKILHRESQVDPMLVATLVRMAVDKLREGSTVTVRVGSRNAKNWKNYFATQSNGTRIEVVEDGTLNDHDCMLETEMGVANFGLDTQLKEVEQGFFDLMALRPTR